MTTRKRKTNPDNPKFYKSMHIRKDLVASLKRYADYEHRSMNALLTYVLELFNESVVKPHFKTSSEIISDMREGYARPALTLQQQVDWSIPQELDQQQHMMNTSGVKSLQLDGSTPETQKASEASSAPQETAFPPNPFLMP